MRPWRSSARPGNTRLGRLVRGLRPDRNPLRRRSDRAETAVLGVLLAIFLAGAPVAAYTAGSWTYATSMREAQIQQTAIQKVRATVLTAATPWNFNPDGEQATARWRAPDGQVRTGTVFLPDAAPAGSTVMVWTNRSGQLADPPLQSAQAASRAELAQASAVIGLAVTLGAVGWLARRALNKRRLAAWDADWRATGPRWSSRR